MTERNGSFRDLKDFCPHPVKQGLKYLWGAIPPTVRYGRSFRRTLAFLRRSQWWSREELERYQRIELKRVLSHAGENIPYYQKVFAELGIRLEHLNEPGILKEIPFLTRQMARENYDLLIDPRTRRRSTITITTGGTSGKQLKIRTRLAHRMVEKAYFFDFRSRMGFTPRSKLATLRGDVVRTDRYRRTWKIDPLRKELLLSSYHLDERNLALYVEKIKRFQPEFIKCYPSTIVPLARFIEQHGITDLPPLKAVLASSENTFPGQRELVERVFGCRYFELYGQSEQVAMAGECEKISHYHLYPQYGFVEIIDAGGNRVTGEGGEGEIVGTGFINTTMPLIRYRTGDWAVLGKPGCSCGRHYPILESIRGRRDQEAVIDKKGETRVLAMGHNASGIYNRVKQYQFHQEKPGELKLTLVRDKGYRDADTEAIRREVVGLLGGEIDLKIGFADNIPRTNRGKFRYFIQKLQPTVKATF